MLRTPPDLTKACGQSHYKKFWLMQTQTDSPDHCIGVSAASVLSFPATLLKGSDGKISGMPVSRSLATELPPQGRAAWSTVGNSDAGFGGISNVHRCNISLSTCAESLTHQQLDTSSYLFRFPGEGCSSADGMDVNNSSPDLEPRRSSGLCVSHSPCVSSSPTLFGSTDQLPSDGTSRETGFSESAIPSIGTTSGRGSAHAIRSGKLVRDCEVLSVCVRDASEENTCSTGSDSCVRGEPFSEDSAQENVVKSAGDSPCSSSERPVEYPNTFFAQNFVEVNGLHGENATHKGCQPASIEQREEHIVESAGVCAGRNVLRMCKLCGTTKTPLWRSGPQGPKSLCNACGIRFKKLRKSQVAGECSYVEASPVSTKFAARSLKRKSASEKEIEFVKTKSRQRFKRSTWPPLIVARRNAFQRVEDTESCLTSPGTPKRQVPHMSRANLERKESDVKLALLENESGLTSVFTSDVKEAAILLMALSCGLVLS